LQAGEHLSRANLQGGCLCGAIRYEVEGALGEASNCHCSMCRRFHGAAFATYAKVDPAKFQWLQGQSLLRVYETSANVGWAFCSVCGSSLGLPENGRLGSIAIGTIEGDPGVRPSYHMFVGSKAPWYEITDELPQYERRPSDASDA
jgi:hypothetical protein